MAEQSERRVPLEPGVEIVGMPRREQAPKPAVGFQQVDQVLVKICGDALSIGPAMQRANIDDVVAHQQIGPGPVDAAPTPTLATLGPIICPGRRIVNRTASHGTPGRKCGNTSRNRWFDRIASRMNRPRSTASASLAQTTRMRNPGLRPSSHSRRMQTWTLLPWSRGSSTSDSRVPGQK